MMSVTYAKRLNMLCQLAKNLKTEEKQLHLSLQVIERSVNLPQRNEDDCKKKYTTYLPQIAQQFDIPEKVLQSVIETKLILQDTFETKENGDDLRVIYEVVNQYYSRLFASIGGVSNEADKKVWEALINVSDNNLKSQITAFLDTPAYKVYFDEKDELVQALKAIEAGTHPLSPKKNFVVRHELALRILAVGLSILVALVTLSLAFLALFLITDPLLVAITVGVGGFFGGSILANLTYIVTTKSIDNQLNDYVCEKRSRMNDFSQGLARIEKIFIEKIIPNWVDCTVAADQLPELTQVLSGESPQPDQVNAAIPKGTEKHSIADNKITFFAHIKKLDAQELTLTTKENLTGQSMAICK